MRLQLIAAIVLGLAATAHAQSTFGAKVQVYADDDHTTVVSPVVEASADVSTNTQVSAGYLADVITSASIDVVSQASATTIHDTRHQITAALSRAFDRVTAHASYLFSTENDYRSHVLATSLDATFDDKNTTLSLGYALALDTVGRSGDHNFAKPMTVNTASVSWTQVLSRRAVAQVSYELAHAGGFQSSPYRFVPVSAAVGATPEYWVPETDPDSRWRNAAVVGVNWYLGNEKSLQADYRLYHDSWGITSSTVGTRFFVNLGPKLELRLRNRFYAQGGASFYRDHYATPQTYMALDRELSPLWSETFGGKLMIALGERLEGELKLDAFYYRYADFPLLPSRLGANVGLGVSLQY